MTNDDHGRKRKITRLAYAGDAGRWEMLRALPHAVLAPHVIDYSGYCEMGGTPVWRRELPCSFVPLIINFGTPFILRDEQMAATPFASFAAGMYDRPVIVGSTGSAHCLQVNFTPLGALRFFGVAQSEMAGRTVSLADILGSGADLLVQELRDCADWASRFTVLDHFIVRRIEAALEPHNTVRRVWHDLQQSSGAASIAGLARSAGVSRRHLAKLFRAEIGATPKTMARILRFEHARRMTRNAPRWGWADIAYAAGYADQAHLAREFKELSGLTPGELSRSDRVETGVIEVR